MLGGKVLISLSDVQCMGWEKKNREIGSLQLVMYAHWRLYSEKMLHFLFTKIINSTITGQKSQLGRIYRLRRVQQGGGSCDWAAPPTSTSVSSSCALREKDKHDPNYPGRFWRVVGIKLEKSYVISAIQISEGAFRVRCDLLSSARAWFLRAFSVPPQRCFLQSCKTFFFSFSFSAL